MQARLLFLSHIHMRHVLAPLAVVAVAIAVITIAQHHQAADEGMHVGHTLPTTVSDLLEAARLFHIQRPVDTSPPSTRPLVILITVSHGYLDFFRNWLHYFRKVGLGMFIVIAEDQAAYDILANDHRLNLKGRVLLADDTEIMKSFGTLNGTDAYRFQSTDFLVLMHRRFVRVLPLIITTFMLTALPTARTTWRRLLPPTTTCC